MAGICKKVLAALVALVLLSAPAFAAGGTWLVSAVNGSDANACTSWGSGNACLSVTGALALATTATCTVAAPCVIAIDAAGTLTKGAAITWTFPAGPVSIISATNPGSGTAITQSPGATESVGAFNAAFTITPVAGTQAYISGMTIVGGNGNAGLIFLNSGNAASSVEFDGGEVNTPSTSAGATVNIGSAGNSAVADWFRSIGTTFLASGSRTGTLFSLGNSHIELINPIISTTGATKPTALFGPNSTVSFSDLIVRDGDISGFNTASSSIFSASPWLGSALLKNLKIGSTPTLTASGTFGTSPSVSGGQITLRNVDSGNTLYKFEYLNGFGTMTVDPVNYLSAGNEFNGAHYGYKIVTTALASEVKPFCVNAAEIWNTDTSSQTDKIEFAQNSSASALTDQQIWASLDYPNSTSFPSYTPASDRNAAPITGTGVAQPTSSAAWAGLTTPTTQYLPNTFTAVANGLLQAQVCVGDPSTTLWINPDLTQ